MSEYVKNGYDIHLLTNTGIYPYDYMNDLNNFNETEPPVNKYFYNQLVREEFTSKSFERASHIWKHFNDGCIIMNWCF